MAASTEDRLKLVTIGEPIVLNGPIALAEPNPEWPEQAEAELSAALDRKVEVFLNPAIRARLDQGKQERVIADLLAKTTLPELRGFLVENATPELVQTINRYLKNIVTKNVKLIDFKPSLTTIEPDQAAKVVKEFEKFLGDQFKSISDSGNATLPMLHFE